MIVPRFKVVKYVDYKKLRKMENKIGTGFWTVETRFQRVQKLYYESSDQLAIGKETGRRLGMGTNMYPSAALLGNDKVSTLGGLLVDELIENADGFAKVFLEHKYEIVNKLQEKKHIAGRQKFMCCFLHVLRLIDFVKKHDTNFQEAYLNFLEKNG